MWLFWSGGLLMPALTPESYNSTTKNPADPKLTDNGRRTLQVRGRIESHLQNFIDEYMEPLGLDYSAIEKTPQLDYNVRFYTTPEDFSVAIAQAVRDIDYKNFKVQAERKDLDGKPLYKDGQKYHQVLVNLWSAIMQLAPAGGAYVGWGTSSKHGSLPYSTSRYLPAKASQTPLFSQRERDSHWWNDDSDTLGMDYTPTKEVERDSLIMEMLRDGIPVEEWGDYLSESEYRLVRDYAEERMSDEEHANMTATQRRRARRQARRAAKRNKSLNTEEAPF